METRRAKRRRKALECDADNDEEVLPSSSTTTTTYRTYFSRIPSDAHIHIVRHLSTRPNNPRWASYVPLIDVWNLVQSGGALRHISRRHVFTALHAHFEYIQPRGRVASGVQLERAGDTSVFNDLLSELSRYVRVLTFDINYVHIGAELFEYCTALRTLYLGHDHNRFDLTPVLKACGNILEELHLGKEMHLVEHHAVAITLYAKNLKCITLEHENSAAQITEMWKAISGKLEKISFSPPSVPGGKSAALHQLTTIAGHCRKLHSVEILLGRKQLPSMPLFTHMGGRLKVLQFMAQDSCPTPAQLRDIVSKCSDAKLHLFLSKKSTVREILCDENIATRIAVLKVRNFLTYHSGDTVFDHLTNLTQVHFLFRYNDSEIEIMQKNFFRIPKNKLVKLQTTRLCNLFKVMNDHQYNYIEDLEVTAKAPIDTRLFGTFLAKNSGNRLKRLWITYKILRGNQRPIMLDTEIRTARLLRKVFEWKKKNNNKMEVVIKDSHTKKNAVSERIRNACVGASGVDVIVGDVQYIPCATKLTRKYIQY